MNVTQHAPVRYFSNMGRVLRDGSGTVLVAAALAALFHGVTQLRSHDYLACIVLTVIGLSLLRAGVELLRPSLGE
jgi:hypothetical protein